MYKCYVDDELYGDDTCVLAEKNCTRADCEICENDLTINTPRDCKHWQSKKWTEDLEVLLKNIDSLNIEVESVTKDEMFVKTILATMKCIIKRIEG